MHRPWRYLAIFAATFVACAGLSAAFTAAVDPYYVFDTPRLAGWNLAKPAAANVSAVAKTYLMERTRPRTLLLGNSRIEAGLDPDSARWPDAMRPVFNAGLPGRGLDIAAKLLEDALAVPGLRHVVVGLDVLDFLQVDAGPAPPPGPVDAGADQDRMRVRPDLTDNPRHRLARVEDMLAATLTLGAVTDSVATILAQRDTSPATMTPLGFNPLGDYLPYVKAHGFRGLFEQKQAQYAEHFRSYPHPNFADPYRTGGFRALREIIGTARAHDIDVTLVIYPYHAWVMDLLRQNGLWGVFETWKRALVSVVGALDPGGHVRIVDFSGYNLYTTTPVPPQGDTVTDVPWYWEPGHFRGALGDRVIARLYDGEATGFGRDLTAATVDDAIAAIRREAERGRVPVGSAGTD